MKIPFPDFSMARAAIDGYAEDGVTGKVSYDGTPSQWYAELDDVEEAEYLKNLKERNSYILQTFSKQFDSTNIQQIAQVPPLDSEKRLALYIIDVDCKASRGFKISNAMESIMDRGIAFAAYGSTCSKCGSKMMAIITWEDVSPRKKEQS